MTLTNKQKKKLLTKAQRQRKMVATVATGMMLGNVLLGPMTVLADETNVISNNQSQEKSDQSQEKNKVALPEAEEKQHTEESENTTNRPSGLVEDVLSNVQNEVAAVNSERDDSNTEVSWNEFSKTLDIKVTNADANEVASKVKSEFPNAIGNIDTLVLRGSFDNTPLSFSNQTVFYSNNVAGDVTKLAPKMFDKAPKLKSVKLKNLTQVTGDEFNLVSSIVDVEVGLTEKDTLAQVQEVFKDSTNTITTLKVNNILGTGQFEAAPFKNLQKVELPKAVDIGTFVFSGTKLTTVDFPNVKTIQDSAFLDAKDLTSVTIPNVEEIENYAFGNTGITTVDFPKLTFLGGGVYKGTKVVSVKIPKADYIRPLAFEGVTTIKEATVGMNPTNDKPGGSGQPTNETLESVATLFKASASAITKLTVMNITKTGDFSSAPFPNVPFPNVAEINMPELTSVGENAFYHTKLTSLDLPNVTSVGDSAFEGNPLETINIPKVKSIGNNGFRYNDYSKLKTINMPELTSVGSGAFGSLWSTGTNKSDLTSVFLPKLSEIGSGVFVEARKIKEVEIGMKSTDKLDKVGKLFNDSKETLEKLTVNNITETGDFFSSETPFSNLTEVSMPAVKTVGGYSFYSNRKLKTINIPKVKSVAGYAFFNCYSLTAIDMPEVTDVAGYAFSYNTANSALKTINMPKVKTVNVGAFGTYGFSDTINENLTSVYMPEITTIGPDAFRGARNIKDVEIGMKSTDTLQVVKDVFNESAESITKLKVNNIVNTGDFNSAPFKNIVEMNLPEATKIGTHTFHLNKTLTSLISPKVNVIGESGLDNTGIKELNVPELKELGKNALYNSWLTDGSFPKLEKIGDTAFALSNIKFLNVPKLKTADSGAWEQSNLDYVFFPATSSSALKPAFDTNAKVVGLGVQTTDVVHNLKEGDNQTLTFNETVLNGSAMDGKTNKLKSVYTKGKEDYQGTPFDYKLTAKDETAGEYQGKLVIYDKEGTNTETGVARKFTVNVKGSLKAPEVNPVTNKDEHMTGKGKANAMVSAKVGGKEIGKGVVTEAGTFDFGIAKQEAGSKINVTQTVDGEESPATVITVAAVVETEGYGEFKLGYWKNGEDGFVLEGRAGLEGIKLGKADAKKAVEFVDQEGTVVKSIPAAVTNWYDQENYDGFQVYMKKDYMAGLPSGDFKVQVRISYKGADYVTAINENDISRGVGSYVDKIENISSYIMGKNFISFGKLNNQMTMSVEGVKPGLNKLFAYKTEQNEQVVDGWMNVNYNFDAKHLKELVITGPGGADDVRYRKVVPTWDINKNYNMGVAQSLAKSGFQAKIPAKFGDSVFTKYIVITDEAGKEVAREELK